MEMTVPPNVTATVYVPTIDRSSVREGGLPADNDRRVREQPSQGGAAVFEIGGGRYRFESTFK
jgi:alpha-L-rhamnosidase